MNLLREVAGRERLDDAVARRLRRRLVRRAENPVPERELGREVHAVADLDGVVPAMHLGAVDDLLQPADMEQILPASLPRIIQLLPLRQTLIQQYLQPHKPYPSL